MNQCHSQFNPQSDYSKVYANHTDEQFRKNIFIENKKLIADKNQLYEEGKVSYKLAMNKYGDLSNHEFVALMTGFNSSALLR